MEGRVMDGIAVDLTDVEVLFYLVHPVRLDPVGDAPDSFGCRVMMIRQLFPVGPLDQGYDTAGSLGCSTMVLAGEGGNWLKGRVGMLAQEL